MADVLSASVPFITRTRMARKLGHEAAARAEDRANAAEPRFSDRALEHIRAAMADAAPYARFRGEDIVNGAKVAGNLLPGTGIFKEKTDHTRDVLELVGPVGDLAKRVASGGRAILTGDVGAGLLQVSRVAVRNAAKGADMAARGMYRDDKGYKVIDTTPTEAAMKAIGFQPASVSKVQEANFINQQAKNFYSMQANEIRALWARGIFEQNQDLVEDARARVEDWNRKNPDQRMVIAMPAVFKRVREMSKTKDQRIADTAPKAMRQALREESARARAAQ